MANKAKTARVCTICKFEDTNKYDYGEWKTYDDCTIHYFCALLSYSCVQNGNDDEGIDGFLTTDIHYTVKAHTKMKCSYCTKKGASVRCCIQGCEKRFHVICGVKRKCLNQFGDQFDSYCHQHVNIKEKYEIHGSSWHCQICNESMGDYDPITSIPSCCDQGYYHKRCIQEYAISAGYLTKCPSCGNDADGYRKFLRSRGIFCPDKDADWELSSKAYISLLYVHKQCDATECLCPKGRDYVNGQGKWKYMRCRFCGSVGTHAACRTNNADRKSFGCENCIKNPSILISVQTNSSCSNNNNAENANTSNKSEPNEHQNGSNDSESSFKRKHAALDDEGEGKVWKMMSSDICKRRKVLQLIHPDDETTIDPLNKEQRDCMRANRLEMFFNRANFDSKPPTPPWII